MLSWVQCHTRGVTALETARGRGARQAHCELAPEHPVPRSPRLPNELAVVAVLAVTAEMGQAAARALCCNR